MSTSLFVVYRDTGDRTWNYYLHSDFKHVREFSVVHYHNSYSCNEQHSIQDQGQYLVLIPYLNKQIFKTVGLGFFNTIKIYFPSWNKRKQTLVLNLVVRLNNTFRLASTQREYTASYLFCLLQTTLQLIMYCLNYRALRELHTSRKKILAKTL